LNNVKSRLEKSNIHDVSLDAVIRVESHSSVILQLVDVLLGAVMFFKKDKQNLISDKNRNKKELVVNALKEKL
jgi:hypothetical protein